MVQDLFREGGNKLFQLGAQELRTVMETFSLVARDEILEFVESCRFFAQGVETGRDGIDRELFLLGEHDRGEQLGYHAGTGEKKSVSRFFPFMARRSIR